MCDTAGKHSVLQFLSVCCALIYCCACDVAVCCIHLGHSCDLSSGTWKQNQETMAGQMLKL